MTEPTVYTLANGMRVVHLPLNREVCHAGLIVDAGSGEENESEHGIAHLIEHLLFKGTKKRKAFHILNRLDAVGGEINAYTTKEETWIVEVFLNAHFDRAIELMADIVLNSAFPSHELEKEKEVIMDEINAYEDNPGDIIFDEFEELIFKGHPLGRSILGTPESVMSFDGEALRHFVRRNYVPENMVLSVVGNIAPKRLLRTAEKYFGHVPASGRHNVRSVPELIGGVHLQKDKDTHQVHYVLGSRAAGAHDEGRVAMALLNNILGGPALNSRLNMAVREKHGYSYFIESHYQPYHMAGYFQIYLGTDEKNFERAKKLVNNELKTLRNKRLSELQLHAAKRQFVGQLALARDNGSALMSNMGKSLQVFNRIETFEEMAHAINSVTSAELLEMANRVFVPENMSSLTYY